MPSRKRSKAKERRIRQEEARIAKGNMSVKELLQWSEKEETIQCNHGCDDAFPDPDYVLVAQFISQSFYKDGNNNKLLTDMLASSFRDHSGVWNTDHLRKKAATIMTNLAARLEVSRVPSCQSCHCA